MTVILVIIALIALAEYPPEVALFWAVLSAGSMVSEAIGDTKDKNHGLKVAQKLEDHQSRLVKIKMGKIFLYRQ